MDKVIANRLQKDELFRNKVKELAQSYVNLGNNSLQVHLQEFDAAYDMFYCYSPLTRRDLEALDRGHPKRFILPITATQITTMATYIAQMLFGTNNPHRVAARNPENEKAADILNVLLRWNAEQQPFYMQGFQWVVDCLLCNRGIMYDHWQPLYEKEFEPVEMEDPSETEDVEDVDENGNAIIKTQPKRYTRWRKKKVPIGGYNKIVNLSPYEFINDPLLPIYRMNEGRFAGHKQLVPWLELYQRSKLDVSDPDYVDPKAVEKIKKKNKERTGLLAVDGFGGATAPGVQSGIISRTRWERDSANLTWNQGKADDKDNGIIEVWVMRIKIRPSDYDIYENDTEPNIWEILIGGDEVLSINEDPYLHDMYPYSVGEARGSVHGQYAPSWALIVKPIQDHIDYLKDKHQDALARTVGNIFIGDPSVIDFDDFTDPEKIGLVIPTKPEASGMKISDYFQQVPINDMTKDFYKEMSNFIDFSESTTAANSQMQGTPENDTTATQSINAQQMSSGRLTSVARILSTTAIQPQTKRFVRNFQQFLDDSMIIRLTADDKEFRPEFQNQSYIQVSKEIIQGYFDVIAEDLSMPGTDTKAVAAATRLIEVAGGFPQYFDPTIEGNCDLRSLLWNTAKKGGIPMDNFVVDAAQAQANMQQMAARQQGIALPQSQQVQAPQPPQGQTDQSTGLPDVSNLPQNLNTPNPSPQQAAGLPNLTQQ